MTLGSACRTWIPLGGGVCLLALVAACSGTVTGPQVAASEKAPAAAKPVSTAGQDWPLLGGTIERNMASEVEKNIAYSWSVKKGKEKNVRWQAALGTAAYGGPVIAGGRVFISTNKAHGDKDGQSKGVVLCFNEADGKFLWQLVHEKMDNPEIDPPDVGLASTPAVDGDRLYYVSNRCELVCADVRGDPESGKGKILWSLDMIKEFKVYPGGTAGGIANCSPLIIDDLVFVVTSNGRGGGNGELPTPEAPSFLAVNKTTGKPAWQSNLPGDKIMNGQWGNPVAGKVNGKFQVIFPGGDGWLYAFEPKTGELIWKFNCNPKDSSYKKGTRHFLIATPVIHDGKLYAGIGRDPDNRGNGVGHLWCIDITKTPKNKDKDLSPVNDNFDPKDPVNKDSGLVWHFGGKVVPEPTDNARDVYFGLTMSTIAVHDGLVYAAEYDGFLNCLDAATGKKYWEHDLSGTIWASPFYADGKVYLGVISGEVFVFAAGKEKKEPVKISSNPGDEVSVPLTAAHGVLYLNTGSKLYAIAPN